MTKLSHRLTKLIIASHELRANRVHFGSLVAAAQFACHYPCGTVEYDVAYDNFWNRFEAVAIQGLGIPGNSLECDEVLAERLHKATDDESISHGLDLAATRLGIADWF